MRVDLPAPFAPTRPMTPGSTSTVRSESAVTRPPYVLVSASVAMRLTAHSLGTTRTRQIRMNPEPSLGSLSSLSASPDRSREVVGHLDLEDGQVAQPAIRPQRLLRRVDPAVLALLIVRRVEVDHRTDVREPADLSAHLPVEA